jgi:hypothetical protein
MKVLKEGMQNQVTHKFQLVEEYKLLKKEN